MTELEITEKIEYLCGVSDIVNQYVDSQIYLMEMDQDSQDEDGYKIGDAADRINYSGLMMRCYSIILGELRELGIFINEDLDEVVSSTYTADGCVALYQLLNKDYLKQLFTLYTEYKEPMYAVLDTSTKETSDEDELTLVQDFIAQYRTLFPDDPYIEMIERVESILYNNDLFKNHIQAILDSAIPNSVIDTEHTYDMTRYIQGIYYGKVRFTEIITDILEAHPEMKKDTDVLMQDCEQYDREKIMGTDIAKYYYAVTNEKNDNLSEQEKTLVKAILDKHKTTQPHHIEYYLANKTHPEKYQLLELTAHHAEPDTSKDEFHKSVEEMLEQGKDLFTPEDVSTIRTYVGYILNVWDNHIQTKQK